MEVLKKEVEHSGLGKGGTLLLGWPGLTLRPIQTKAKRKRKFKMKKHREEIQLDGEEKTGQAEAKLHCDWSHGQSRRLQSGGDLCI